MITGNSIEVMKLFDWTVIATVTAVSLARRFELHVDLSSQQIGIDCHAHSATRRLL